MVAGLGIAAVWEVSVQQAGLWQLTGSQFIDNTIDFRRANTQLGKGAKGSQALGT